MDPITIAMGITALVGTGTSMFGALSGKSAASHQAEIAGQIAGVEGDVAQQEMAINAQRRQQMVLTAQRQQMQTLRNVQLARSMALSAATNQGAQFGTGLAGGLAQIGGQGANDLLNLNQNFEIGKNVFDLNTKIDEDRMKISSLGGQMADYQGKQANAQGIMNMGSAISGIASPFSRIFGTMFGGGGMPGTGATGGMGGNYGTNSTSNMVYGANGFLAGGV